ncbi:MAG TPA: PP2C family serine/threonine-protein phosphatase [Burkholderiales bacterium]|nr:PP2C family serine/threonine-protein phosphatase [Burkholderiales bacterium]
MRYALVHDSRIGARRTNQDRIGCWSTEQTLLMAVADGLGGHLHGEVAAELATALLGAAFTREAQPRLTNPGAFLERSLGAAHAAILREAERRGLPDSPRTVVVACVVQDGHAYWTHVGDSRLYLVRDGRIVHRTRDHTVVQQLIDEGRIREEAVATHPERNRLLQCLGGYQAPRPEPVERARLARNDIVLLCSDGLWGPLTQRQLLQTLALRELKDAIPELVTLAEHRAGRECDNVSVVAMSWGEDEVADSEVTVPEGPRTDIQDFTATDLDFMRMTDEDIDKAIADLKAALRKHLAG